MKPYRYILKGGEPVPEPDLLTWGQWMEAQGPNRRLAVTSVSQDVEVSTVFLGLDHRFGDSGPPILWETMVFGGTLDGEQDRYSTRDGALVGHAAMVARVLESLKGSEVLV